MDFMNMTNKEFIYQLLDDNLYRDLSFEEQCEYENEIRGCVETFSLSLETEFFGGKYKGVKLELVDEPTFRMQSCLIKNDAYRGSIIISRLLIIAMYQTFYGINYNHIVVDGKNVENIKHILFIQAFVCMIRHEFAHIYKGHLNLYQKWDEEGTKKNHILDIKTLEWDADSYAATQLISLCIEAQKLSPIDTTDFYVKIMCLALHGLMYWQRRVDDFEGIGEREHLPFSYREISMIRCISDFIPNGNKLTQYIVEYEKVFNNLFGIKSNEVMDYYSNFISNTQELTRVEENWENVKKQLEPYSVFPLEDLLD